MSATKEYEAAVKARGWIYLPQLPANTPLGKRVAGLPGARSAWHPNGSRYEVAPTAVIAEQKAIARFIEPGITDDDFTDHVRDRLETVAAATGLDHGIPGVVAKVLGIPPWVLLIVLVVVGWAVLRQYRVVPSVKEITG